MAFLTISYDDTITVDEEHMDVDWRLTRLPKSLYFTGISSSSPRTERSGFPRLILLSFPFWSQKICSQYFLWTKVFLAPPSGGALQHIATLPLFWVTCNDHHFDDDDNAWNGIIHDLNNDDDDDDDDYENIWRWPERTSLPQDRPWPSPTNRLHGLSQSIIVINILNFQLSSIFSTFSSFTPTPSSSS